VRAATVSWLLLAVLFAAESSTTAAAAASVLPPAVQVGIRSALSSGTFRRRRRGRLANVVKRSSSDVVAFRAPGSRDSSDDENEREVIPSFFRPPSAEDRDEFLAAEYAYLKASPGVQDDDVDGDSCESELDQMEALTMPASLRRQRSSLKASSATTSSGANRGGASASAMAAETRPLVFWENMIAGAISRSMAQTIMHPANTLKTILQNSRTPVSMGDYMNLSGFRRLSIGAGANFVLSVPHGAVNFAVLEFVRKRLSQIVQSNPALSQRSNKIGPGLDFLSSAISTITCSVVSTPQMMITDNIMAGKYKNKQSVRSLRPASYFRFLCRRHQSVRSRHSRTHYYNNCSSFFRQLQ